MTEQEKKIKKKNLSFFSDGLAVATTATVTQVLFTPYEKTGDNYLTGHFNYEISMLLFADSRIDGLIPERNRFEREGNKSKQEECTAEINMALETFVIHWRALIEFFYKTERRPGDMRADDFINRNKWQKTRESIPCWVKDLNSRAGKEIAHLTSLRKYGTPPEKNWPYKKMKKHLEKVIKLFAKEANLQISQ